MSEVYNHLCKLYELTRNPKYALDIAEICVNSGLKQNIDYAISIYKNLGDSYSLSKAEFPDHFKDTMSGLLNKKTIENYDFREIKDKLTVIIPTMWLAPREYFANNVREMNLATAVDKVIIINNAPGVKGELQFTYPKVKVISNNKNVGVNPAWNQGIAETETEFYLLLNDDCLVDSSIVAQCAAILARDKEVGIVNCHTKKVSLDEYIHRNDDLRIDYVNHLGGNPNGWFIMGRTKEYQPIPSSLVYFYGDNLIHHNALKSGKRVVKLISDYISHDVSTTVKSLDLYRQGLLETEGVSYRSIIGG